MCGILLRIRSILQKLDKRKITTVLSVVFVAGGITLNLGVHGYRPGAAAVAGGPGPFSAPKALTLDETFLGADYPKEEAIDSPAALLEEAALGGVVSLPGGLTPSRDGLSLYKVKKGDTLSGIAKELGISLSTILWANPGLKAGRLQIGQEISVLPVTGFVYKVEEGDTLETIAGLHGTAPEKILTANKGLNPGLVEVGLALIIPDAAPRRASAAPATANLKKFVGVLPAAGWNQGILHSQNGVDISNRCGTSIYAAQEGLVTRVGDPENWNQGYGGMMVIEHPNGAETLYGHTQKNLAAVGDYVNQGQLIAEMGNTGNVDGKTGCHLHFEVHGAANWLASK